MISCTRLPYSTNRIREGAGFMPTIEEQIDEVQQQEKELQFEKFTSETALEIGLALIERAKREHLNISIDIRRNGHQLFHYSFQGTSPDNDVWLQKKCNTVNRFNVSSLLYTLRLKKSNRTFADVGLDTGEYAWGGGGFPLTVRNVGVVGSICVSGLKDTDDHDLIVWAIGKVIGGNK
jgi:uncharacterized protein (UPF0303 family)